MSFGRKGLAPGQAAPAPGGFGRATPADPRIGTSTPSGGTITLEKREDPDDIAAKREAFIAAERARRAQEDGAESDPAGRGELSGLHNSSRSAARPAQRLGTGPVGENGLTADQEEEIRLMARGMAGGRSQPRGSQGRANPGARSGYVFGDPAGRHIGIAYLLWFVLGQFSLHRFYCGQKDTAIMQAVLLFGSLFVALIFIPLGIAGFLGWCIWIVADLFLIPGMLKKFQEEHDPSGAFR